MPRDNRHAYLSGQSVSYYNIMQYPRTFVKENFVKLYYINRNVTVNLELFRTEFQKPCQTAGESGTHPNLRLSWHTAQSSQNPLILAA